MSVTPAGRRQLTAQASATTTSSIGPPNAGSVKIGIVHVDPTTAGTVTWTGGTTGLGQAAQAVLACISVGYKEEDTAGALAFTSTITAPAIGTLICRSRPGVAGVAFVPRIMGVY